MFRLRESVEKRIAKEKPVIIEENSYAIMQDKGHAKNFYHLPHLPYWELFSFPPPKHDYHAISTLFIISPLIWYLTPPGVVGRYLDGGYGRYLQEIFART